MLSTRYFLPSVFLVLLAGCGEKPAQKPALPPISEAETSAIKALGDVKAVVKTDEAGAAVDVSLAKLEVTPDIIGLLAKLPSLRTLNLSESSLSDDTLTTLEKAVPKLASLDVRGSELSDKSAELLAHFTGLRALRFSGKSGKTTISDDGLKLLAACKSLKVLALDDLWIGTPGLEALAGLSELEELYLAGTVIDDDTCKLIAKYPRIRKLRLARTQVSDAGLEALSACKTLEEIDLSEDSLISDEGMAHLAKLTNLKKLNLWRVQITDAGAVQLAPLTKLEWLNLDNSKLADGGLVLLKDMKSLTFLHIGSTQVTEAGAASLFHLKSLKDLKVTRTALGASDSAVAELKKNLPDTVIQTEYVEAE